MLGPASAGAEGLRKMGGELGLAALAAAGILWVLLRGSPNLPFLLIGATAGVGVICWTVTHRATALAAMFVAVPLQVTVLAWLYAHGAPFAAVRYAGFFKEVVIMGLVVAVLLDQEARRHRMGAAEWAGLAFVAITTFYLVLPAFVPGVLGGQSSTVRFSAWRLNVIFVVLFLACRRLRWTSAEMRLLENALLVAAAVLSVGAIWELLDESGFEHFVTDVVQQPRFHAEVLDSKLQSVVAYEALGDGTVTRVGSWTLSPLTLAFCLVTPLAIGVRRLISGQRGGLVLIATAATGVALLSTHTRSAILAGLIAIVLVLALSLTGRQRRATEVLLGFLLVAVCAAPYLPQSSIYERFLGAANGTEESAQTHQERTSSAWNQTLDSPLGFGLGSNPGTGAQYETDNYVTAENAYLQVSLELGWLAAVLFILMTVALIWDLFSLARSWPGSSALAAAGAGLGLAVGGFFLHVWVGFQTAMLFWGFAGAAGARALAAVTDRSVPVSEEQALAAESA